MKLENIWANLAGSQSETVFKDGVGECNNNKDPKEISCMGKKVNGGLEKGKKYVLGCTYMQGENKIDKIYYDVICSSCISRLDNTNAIFLLKSGDTCPANTSN